MGRLGAIRAEMSVLMKLALPVLVAQLLMASNSLVDTIMSGQAGTKDLAGVGVASSLWAILAMFLVGTFMAINPLVGQHRARSEYGLIASYVQHGLWLALPTAVVLMLLLSHPEFILSALVQDPQVLVVSRGYLEGLAWGIPAILGFIVLKPFSEGMSYTKAQTVSAAVGALVNVPANYVLIFGKFGFPELGGAGCGWATSLAFWAMFFTLLIFIRWHPVFTKISLFGKRYPLERGKIAVLLRLGLPVALAITIEGSTFALVTLFIAALPAAEIAGHQVAMSVAHVGYMVPFSMSTAITIRVAAFVGVDDWRRAHVSVQAGLALAILAGLLLALGIYFGRQAIADLYSDDARVIEMASLFLLFSIGFKLFDSIAAPLQGALRGYHDVNSVLWASVLAYWVVCLPLGYLFGLTDWLVPAMGARGYWITLVVGVALSALLLSWRYHLVSRDRAKRCSA